MCAASTTPKIRDVTMSSRMSTSTSLNLKFNSFKEFQEWKERYQNDNYVQLATVESRKLPVGHTLAELVVYKTIIYGCKYGKKVHKSSATKICVTSYKQGCPFRMVVKCRGDKLQIVRLNEVHNGHPINEKSFKHLPEQRRLSRQEKMEAEILLSCKASKKQVQTFLMQKTNKVVLMKDIHNIASKIKYLPSNTHNLQELILELKGIPRSMTLVVENEQDDPIGVYFQDQRMSKLFDAYPETIIYDVTFNLTSCQMDVILLLVIDGNGESEICCIWFVKRDCVESVGCLADEFRSRNPKSQLIEAFFTDRNLTHRECLQEKFPSAQMENSPFHVLKQFSSDVSSKKLGITESDRQTVLKFFEDMLWANSENHYNKLYEQLSSLRLCGFMSYFESKWQPIAREWMACSRNHCVNYMNKVTNKVENLAYKLQSFVNKYSQLQPFFIDFMVNKWTGSVDNDHRDMIVFQKVPVTNVRHEHWNLEEQITSYLTPFAYEKVLKQFEVHDMVEFDGTLDIYGVGKVINTTGRVVETTLANCTCGFWTKMTLPCRHMFAFRKELNEPLFNNDLCHKRWTREYMQSSLFDAEDASQKAALLYEETQNNMQKNQGTGGENVRNNTSLLEFAWKMASAHNLHLNEHYTEQLKKFIDLMADGKKISVEEESMDSILRGVTKAGRKRKRAGTSSSVPTTTTLPPPTLEEEEQIVLTDDHEIHTPISYILISTELEKDDDDPSLESKVEIVTTEIE
ncbi:hypothetical protein CHUAL_014177 [Chamberlinius hualienensis]